ncbi:MurR/RpiR family transcriptional regulator [Shouchella miscanthi]|uniref:MurR/RpiR family transcriptional regulator n=1 Tax=Shouchella miscanthi TaxID=2598861 RepID=A0ABU6NF21_9BACI|nr:MurR/RpiR family transcriptional regulator [Shouchella miscanthi]MED4126601.1 MurR/RpiR family transcriptional regulator [Shouchella miscanthi]
MLRFEERITLKKKSLTATEEKIIHQLKVQDKPFLLSMGELAMLSEVSEPSVVRLYKKLEYQSYQELKVALAQEMADMKPSSLEIIDIAKEDMAETIFEKMADQVFQAMALTKERLSNERVEEAVQAIIEANRLYFFGQGLSATMAEDGAHKFMRLGGNVLSVKDPHYQAIYASHMTNKDVILAISHSGETTNIYEVLKMAKKHGAYLIVITANEHSSIASVADNVFLTQAHETKHQSDAMISRLVQLVLMDTLYTRVAAEAGEDAKQKINQSRLAVTRMKK